MNTIRWGILGCGDVTEVKSGPGFQKARGSELVAVMRRNGDLAKDYAHRHHVPVWYDDAEDLIHDSNVDAVYIATPPSSHKEYALAAAKAKKPVYVEKPMAMSYAECCEMIEGCKQASVPLFVAYYRRAQPRFLKIKSLLEEGVLGEIRRMYVRYERPPLPEDFQGSRHWRTNPAIAGAGYFFDMGSHMIDLLYYFLGPIKSAQGYFTNQGKLYSAEDSVCALMQFDEGVHGAGVWNFCAAGHFDETEIIGTKGTISYSTFSDSLIRIKIGSAMEEISIPNPEHVQQPLIQTVVDELLGKGKCPSTGETGAMASWAMDKILGKI